MSFLFVCNMCRTNMTFTTIKCVNLTNFKNHRLKDISSFSTNMKNFYGTKLHSIYFTDVFEKYLLNVTQYCVENKRKAHLKSPHQKYVIKPKIDSHKKALSHKSLTNSLQKCESVADQIELFNSNIKLTDNDIRSRYLICQELEKILKPYYISCSVCLIGSSVNGFGLKGCDVDLSLQYSAPNFDQSSSDTVTPLLEENLLERKIPPKLYNFPPKNQLLSIRKILQDLKFEEPLTVVPGRCPILNLYFQNLSCDLSINNSSALQGTNLMLLCSKLDERVSKLVRIIIYWAKHSKLIGGPVKFKSYAMFLLAVYFLQTRSPPVLPPVEVMFDKTDFFENLENWPYNVQKYISSFEKSKNTQSVAELLREFFFFYGNFDFSYIICPLNGCSVERKTFATKIDCENSFLLNTICIQDPLNPAWNVTTEVNWKNCKSLLKAMISVCEIYHNSNCWFPGPNNWGLASLIDSEFSYHNLKDIKEILVNVPVASITPDKSAEDNIEVLENAADLVKQIMKYCLLFPCYRLDSDTNFSSFDFPQNVKAALQTEFSSSTNCLRNNNHGKETNSNFAVSYVCVTRDTWAGRNSFISIANNTENLLEKEHTISKMMDLERGSNEKEVFYFMCQCYTRHLVNDIHLFIKFKPLNNNRFIPKLAVFLREYIPNVVDSLLSSQRKK